jgi:DNA primase
MLDANGRVIGVRLRNRDGGKYALTGSSQGLFIPSNLSHEGSLLVSEGASDVTALLDLGFEVLGLPSCQAGSRMVVEYVRRDERAEAVIVADADAPGQSGARALAMKLVPYCETVRVITPPDGIKDARKWKQSGATREDVLAAIRRAQPICIAVAKSSRKQADNV